MLKSEKFIQNVYDAVRAEIQEYEYAHKSKEGLLEHLQGYSWKFDEKLCEKYFGHNAHHFGVFDTQAHLNEFIQSKGVQN